MRIVAETFIGRKESLGWLSGRFASPQAELVVITGRRRVGKSALVKEFAKGRRFFQFEGLEGEGTDSQIKYFTQSLKKQFNDPILNSVDFTSWDAVFQYLGSHIINNSQKTVLFFDELQWMAAGQGSLISLIKAYWDNEWKNKKIMLILCGSITSFMMKKVIHSKALYGRITGEIRLKGLPPGEAIQMFKGKRGFAEVLDYLLVFGGVPKYLEMLDLNKSFSKNINELCFGSDAIMLTEFEKIFYSQFKRHKTYMRIVKKLRDKMLSLNELSHELKMASGGGLQRYLIQLEEAEFIRSFVPFGQNENSKFRKYRLSDEFLFFYFQFIEPNLRTIRESSSKKIFELISSKTWPAWCGFAFERFCIKHAYDLAKTMGFGEEVLSASPYFERGDNGFQIDLLYRRADKVITLCEIKYNSSPVDTKVIAEVERKARLFRVPRGHTLEKALVCSGEISPAVVQSGIFHHIVPIGRIFEG